MSNMEDYKHKYVYELTLTITGDCVIYVDDPAIADEIAINEFISCDIGLDEGQDVDKKTYKYLYGKVKITKKEEG